jgi:hypothetical protein
MVNAKAARLGLKQAIVAYSEALKEDTRGRVPLPRAMAPGNLGVTFRLIAERLGGAARAPNAGRPDGNITRNWSKRA